MMHFLFLKTFIIVVQILSALVVIGLVLLQHGKAADMGVGFSGGASGSLFGASGSVDFLSRTTAIFATVFFTSTLFISILSGSCPSKMHRKALWSGEVPLAKIASKENIVPTPGTETISAIEVPSRTASTLQFNVPK
ncbi:preprotein translocase subunit SecG [Candidatus Vallotia lariciata]|uniref:preprotein translocase subunit SecG n=1 Tax=Candidatus Vallotia laricis TaxID=2018052 RepID=UPI001D01F7E4|nr:preprotein translocase subunit SecG [Candidatus Vallotia lariciata]UDG82934.1 Protein translocase subunit secG [Candidatus Vallotia lariciata]